MQNWNKSSDDSVEQQSIPNTPILAHDMDARYKTKLKSKSPSLRAIRNYNSISIENCDTENFAFIPEPETLNEYATYPRASSQKNGQSTDSTLQNSLGVEGCESGYSTLGRSLNSVTRSSFYGSELGSQKVLMASGNKLGSTKIKKSCQTWWTNLETVLCTISLAAGFGNLYRLPQTTFQQGGLPFLVIYVILTVLIGLPLLFLELGIGQLAQDGFIKSWRAVPFFKGVGYVKLFAGCLVSIYYPLYMGLSFYYIVWTLSEPIPFPECASVKMTKVGYSPDGIDGQQCLKKTFLESPFKDPSWYGIFAGILFVIWAIVIFISLRRTKSFIRSLLVLFFLITISLVALTVKSVFVENELNTLQNVTANVDWTILQNAEVWYYASVQVFFSTTVGFGSFVTNAGIIYKKKNPFLTALGFIVVNIICGVCTVAIFYILFGHITKVQKIGDIPEVHLEALLYTVLINDKSDLKYWVILIYVTILLSGFISMTTFTYMLLKAITVQIKRRMKWWQTSLFLGLIGFLTGCCILLQSNFQIVRLLDRYIVGNLICISVIIEVFALIAFYGTDRIKSDFEFMLGHILSNIWLLLWWFLPLMLTAIFAWSLITMPNKSNMVDDPIWLTATGTVVNLAAIVFIIAIGCYTVSRQEAYTLAEKLKSALRPSSKWGPKDPMLRHNWVQWNMKTQQGERDFTLKRKGTRDYTRSVKKNAKKATISELSTELTNGQNYGAKNEHISDFKVTSLIDSLDSHTETDRLASARTAKNKSKRDLNTNESLRKGPYVIDREPNHIVHVCHRRLSEIERDAEIHF